MKNLIMGVLIVGCLGGAAFLFFNGNSAPQPVAPNTPPPAPPAPTARPIPPQPRAPVPRPIEFPTRTYPAPIAIAEADLPAKVTSLILALNVLENDDLRTTGQDLAALPAAAVPLMRKALERDDLSWVAIAALGKAIELIERRESAKQMTDTQAARLAWTRDNTLGQYLRTGHRNPAADVHMTEALELWALIQADAPTAHAGLRPRILDVLENARITDCDDGLLWYVRATLVDNHRAMPQNLANQDEARGFVDAARRMKDSGYSHYRKAWSFIKAARFLHLVAADKINKRGELMEPDTESVKWRDLALEEIRLALETEIKDESFATLLIDYYLDACAFMGNGRQTALEAITPAMQKAFPDGGALAAIRGRFYIDWAWDARGSGLADTVRQEDWPRFHERLELARKSLFESIAKYPKRSDLPTDLIKVLMVTNADLAEVEKYLKLAVRNDPNNSRAPATILAYIEPKWGGSWPAAFAFARQCLLTGNWEDHFADRLLDLHFSAAQYPWTRKAEDEGFHHSAYFKNEKVFKEIEFVCLNSLRWFPGDRDVISRYIIAAHGAEQWDLADSLLRQTTDYYNYNHFRSKPFIEAMRKKAGSMARQRIQIPAAIRGDDAKLREFMVKTPWRLEYFDPELGIRRFTDLAFSADGRTTDPRITQWTITDGILHTHEKDLTKPRRWSFNSNDGLKDLGTMFSIKTPLLAPLSAK